MINAETDGQRIWLTAETEWRYTEMIKALPGSKWDNDKRRWSVRLSWSSCRQLAYMFGAWLTVGPDLLAWVSRELTERVQPALNLRMATNIDSSTHPYAEVIRSWRGQANQLYGFQEAGALFMALTECALLADEMGSGKTPQTVMALSLLAETDHSPWPCLVVCPKSVRRQWVREFQKWCPGVDVVAPESGVVNLRKALASEPDVVVLNYEVVRAHSRLAAYGSIALTQKEKTDQDINKVAWASVVVDEAHRIKTPAAKQTRALWRIGHADSVHYRYALTGTPISKAPDDLWAALHFIVPQDFPTRSEYVDRYCTPPDSMVYMADGTFKAIGEITPGEMVMGFPKTVNRGRGKHTKYSPTKVLAVNHREDAELVRVTTSIGDSFVCTPDHIWMTGWKYKRQPGQPRGVMRREMQFSEPVNGMEMRKVIAVPEPLPDSLRDDAMWLGGMFDGEGTHSIISQSASANPDLYARIRDVMTKLDIPFTEASSCGDGDCSLFRMTGGRDSYARFLHFCRPTKRHRYDHSGSLSGTGRATDIAPTIVGIEPVGSGPVVSLTTETQTYIVHGYASHNCLQAYSPHGGLDVIGIRPEMKQEFFEVVDCHMRRMPKALVLPFLPPKVRTTRETPMGTKQAKAYKAMDEEMMAELEGGGYSVALSPIVERIRKMQFASAYAQVESDGQIKLAEPSNKLDELMEILEELGDEQVVVFAMSRQLIELASERLTKAHIRHGLLIGGQTEGERQTAQDDFRSGRIRVMLGTSAGGTGVDGLQVASHLVFLQRFDSLVDNLQAEDRVHRIGSEVHSHIQYIDLVTPGTIEEKQIDDLHRKLDQLQEIVRDRATLWHAAQQGDQVALSKVYELDAAYAEMVNAPAYQGENV